MATHQPPPPRKATRAALYAALIVGAVILVIFVGFNLYHADTQSERQSGQMEPRDAPKTPTDLQSTPPRR